MEHKYIKEKFQSDYDIVNPQDNLYSIAWETESNTSILDHPKLYSDPVTPEHWDSRDAINQHNDDSNFTREYKNASDSIAEAPSSDTHSSQDYVKTLTVDTSISNDATTGNDDTSNGRDDPNIQYDTDSTTSTKVFIPTNQNDATNQDETFSRGGEYNLRPNPNPNFSDSYR